MKKYKVTPLETMEIELLDKTLHFRFDMQAIAKIQETYGALDAIANNKTEFEMASIILWAGVKDNDFTVEDAEVVVSSSVDVLTSVLTITTNSIMQLGGDDVAKKLKEEMEKVRNQTA